MQLSDDERNAALGRIAASSELAASPRMVQLLRYLVTETIAGRGGRLKETVIGLDVFNREASYDPKTDPVVRVEVRRLRGKLLEYYDGSGASDAIRISLPKGSYQAAFTPIPAEARPRSPGWRWVAGIVAALVAVLLGGWLISTWWQPLRPMRAPRLVSGQQEFSRSPVFSADGQELLFSRDGAGAWSHIYRQRLSAREPVAVTTGNVRDYEPAWAANGVIAFLREKPDGRFTLMTLEKGGERAVAEVGIRSSMSFLPDGSAILASDHDDGQAYLVRIALADGRKTKLTNPGTGMLGDLHPRLQPGGQWIAFVRAKEAAVQDVWRVPLSGGEPTAVTSERRLIAGLDWTADGKQILLATARGDEARSLWRVDPERGIIGRVAEAGIGLQAPAVSRRGQRLAYVTRISDTNLWRVDLGVKSSTKALTSSIQMDTGPQISPDGKSVAFRSNRTGFDEVWLMSREGLAQRRLTSMTGPVTGSARWSPDGSRLVFDSRPEGNGDIFAIPMAGGAPRQLTREKSNEVLPSWSRDGRSLYFTSDRTGTWEVFRMPSDGGAAEQLTHAGGSAPFESADGQWVYYVKRSGDGGIWRMAANGGPEERVAPLAANLWGQWALSGKGLFYAIFNGPGERAIRRLDLATGSVRDVVQLSRMPVQFDSGMSIAPDESWICWAQLDSAGSDIFVIDQFR